MIRTRLTELLRIDHPILQAGMARRYTSAELVAAVSNAGGLGILGCLGRSVDETVADIRRIRALTDRPFGVNFVLHLLDREAFDAALGERVPVFSFFRGDEPAGPIASAHATGALVIHQVTTVTEADQAIEAGADILAAQGREAGGHGGFLPLTSIVADVVARARARPVVAAGGIVGGDGLAAALALGASGVMVGTRFLASEESPTWAGHKQAIVDAPHESTLASAVFDLLSGEAIWPGVRVRLLRNRFTERVAGMTEAEVRAALPELRDALREAVAADDPAGQILLAGMGASRISDVAPAGEIVGRLAAEAEERLRRLAGEVRDPPSR